VSSITFRTTDFTKWGAGQGSNLTNVQVDDNFWFLYELIVALQEEGSGGDGGIASFSVVGASLFVTLTSGAVLGPYPLPVAQWNPRGAWAPTTAYAIQDVVSNGGALYLVIFPHTSGATFNANANDGAGHNFYALLLAEPSAILPAGGAALAVLAKHSATDFDTEWLTLTRNLTLFVAGQPGANELLLYYVAPEAFTLPAGLTNSRAGSTTAAAAAVSYGLFKNGVAIGSVNFAPTTFTFTAAVSFAPGDVLTIVGPTVPDAAQANIGIVLVATLP